MFYMFRINRQVWTVEVSQGNTTKEVFRGTRGECFKFMKKEGV